MLKASIPSSAKMPNGQARPSLGAMIGDIKQGFVYVWSSRVLRAFLFVFFVFGVMNAMIATLPLYSLRYTLTSDVETYQHYAAMFSFFLGLSFVLGSLSASVWSRRFSTNQTVKFGVVIVSVLLTLLGVMPSPVLFFTTLFVAGYFIVMINITIGGWIPQIVAPAYMGRTASFLDPASLAAKSAGLLMCGWLFPQILPLTGLYVVFGVLLLLGASIVWRLMR